MDAERGVSELVPRIMFVEELPPIAFGNGRPRTIDIYVQGLKERPGVWALVHRRPKTTKNAFGGRSKALRDRGCEAHQRTVGDELHLYARWPAEKPDASPLPRFFVGDLPRRAVREST